MLVLRIPSFARCRNQQNLIKEHFTKAPGVRDLPSNIAFGNRLHSAVSTLILAMMFNSVQAYAIGCLLGLDKPRRVRLFAEIGQCTELTQLDLQHNDLVSLPSTMGNLSNLIRLGIRYNKLRYLPPGMSNCHKLEEFIVESNQLEALPVKIYLFILWLLS